MADPSIRSERETEQGSAAHAEIAAGLVLVAGSVFALLWLIPENTLPSASEHDISPALFPTLAAWAVLALSAVLIGTRLSRLRAAARAEPGFSVVLEIAVWTVIGGITMLGLSTVGFVATAALVIAFWMVFGGCKTWWRVLLIAIVFPLTVEQLAWIVFTVQLP